MTATTLALLTALLVPVQDIAPPEPTAHHEHLKQFVGKWDAVQKFMTAPGEPMDEAKASETSKLGPGGLWLIFDYKGSMAGAPFTGHGVMGYNPDKKKYIGSWVDSFTHAIQLTEGTCSDDGRKFTMTYTTPNPHTGEPMTMRQIQEILGKDRKKITFIMPGPDGKEMTVGTIEYTRRPKKEKRKE